MTLDKYLKGEIATLEKENENVNNAIYNIRNNLDLEKGMKDRDETTKKILIDAKKMKVAHNNGMIKAYKDILGKVKK